MLSYPVTPSFSIPLILFSFTSQVYYLNISISIRIPDIMIYQLKTKKYNIAYCNLLLMISWNNTTYSTTFATYCMMGVYKHNYVLASSIEKRVSKEAAHKQNFGALSVRIVLCWKVVGLLRITVKPSEVDYNINHMLLL